MFRPAPLHRRPASGLWVLLLVILICCAIEAVLQVAEAVGPGVRLRAAFYENGAFWVGLLHHWPPNYGAQPYTMFLTYGFLHAGMLHLAVNMISLWTLGRSVIDRVGVRGFGPLYFGAMIGGGAGHAALAAGPNPVVGASGALFGLAGSLLAWDGVDRYAQRKTLWPILQAVTLLVVLNIVLWWALDGFLAWQVHLGGFVAGCILAMLIGPRPSEADETRG